MDEMVNSNGPAAKLGLSFPSSSNLDSMSWKELMELLENGGGSFTVSVRKLYLLASKVVMEQGSCYVRCTSARPVHERIDISLVCIAFKS